MLQPSEVTVRYVLTIATLCWACGASAPATSTDSGSQNDGGSAVEAGGQIDGGGQTDGAQSDTTGSGDTSTTADTSGVDTATDTSNDLGTSDTGADAGSTDVGKPDASGDAGAGGKGCKTDLDCKVFGGYCLVSEGICVECLNDSQCEGGKSCVDHQCGGSGGGGGCLSAGSFTQCAGELIQYCDPESDQWGVPESCPPGQKCAAGECEDVCTAGTKECVEGFIKQCNASGVGLSTVDDCLLKDKGCAQGACVAKGCDVGEKCDGSKLMVCDNNQFEWQITDCAANKEVCYDGACEPAPCTANQKGCFDDVAVQCNANASAVTVIEDCAAKTSDGQSWSCEEGACVPQVCLFLDSKCEGTVKYSCNAKGTGFEVAEDCAKNGEVCVDGQCGQPPCAPNKLGCDGKTTVVQCDASGGFAAIKTCAPGTICDGGACLTQVCNPYDSFCDGNVIMDCNDTGTAASKSDDCSNAGEVCFEGLCGPQVCTPSTAFCSFGKLATCTGTGGGFAESDCPAGQFCSGSACTAATCALPSQWPSVQRVNVLTLAPAGIGCDLDGDGKKDNAAHVLDTLLPFPLQDEVDAGDLNLLLSASSWKTDGSPFEVSLYDGWLDPDDAMCWDQNQDMCAYLVDAASLDLKSTLATCPAHSVFKPASVQSLALATGGANPVKLRLPLFGWQQLWLKGQKASIAAKVQSASGWQTSSLGTLCMAVTQADLAAAVAQIPEDNFDPGLGGKAAVVNLLATLADLDLDKDGKKESVSFALQFESIEASISGLGK